MEKELYWKMYAILCGAVSDAIEALQDPQNSLYARNLLQQAILQAEELYVSHKEDMDITFDGTNYIESNVDKTTASED